MSGVQELLDFIHSVDPNFNTSSINSVNTSLYALDNLFDEWPKQTANKIDFLIAIVQRTANGIILCDDQDRYQLLDFLIGLVKKYPKLVKKNKYRISQIYKIILDVMIITVNQPTHQWMNPPNGFKESQGHEGSQNILISSICSCCDQFSQTIDFDDVVNYLQPLYIEYMQKNDNWRYQFAALMLASQIGVTKAEISKIGVFVQVAFMAGEHKHPKVRYATMHMLGQLADDFGSEFGQIYYESFVPLTLKFMQDSVPRVIAHTLASITNFFDECEQSWRIQNVIEQYLSPMIHCLKNSQSWVMENTLSALNSFAMTENAFGPHLGNLVILTYEIINNYSGQQPFKQMIGQSIELLGTIFSHQKNQLVENYLIDYIKILFAKRGEIQVTYFMLGWRKICLTYQNFTDLTNLYPILLESCKKMMDEYSDGDSTNGFLSLEQTFVAFKTQAAPFVDQTISFAKTTFENHQFLPGIREASFKLMICVMKETKPNEPHLLNEWISTTKNIFTYIFDEIDKQFADQDDLDDLPMLFRGVEQLTSAMNISFNNSELLAFCDKMLYYGNKLQQHHTNVENNTTIYENDEDMDSESEFEFTDDRIEDLEESLERIPDILEQIIKFVTDPNIKSSIIEKIQSQIETSIQKEKDHLLHYGLELTLAILQVLQYVEISHYWNKFTEICVHFSTHKNPRIRNGAVYGLNLIINKSPSGKFDQKEVQNILQLFSNAFTLPFEQQSQNKFYIDSCKDNLIAALGTLIKCYANVYPEILNETVRGHWLSQLPLNNDMKEGNDQQDLLIDIITHSPNFLIKDVKDLITVCKVYAKFVVKRSDREYKENVQRTKRSLLTMSEWGSFKQNTDFIWNNLTISERNILAQLMKND